MDTVALDMLKVLEYIEKRREDYAHARATTPDVGEINTLYEGRVEAYDDVLDKVRQVLGSHAVSSQKFAEQVRRRLRS